MKKFGLSLFTLCVLASSAAFAEKNKDVSSRIGERADKVPCTCVFNNKRKWNPEKVMWNNAYWKCSIYKDDGTCSEVQKIKDVSVE